MWSPKDWKLARRYTAPTAETAYPDACACGCDVPEADRRRIRSDFLDVIIDDVVPTAPVWVRSHDDPELIFTYSPGVRHSR
jgi:hypothetical protein